MDKRLKEISLVLGDYSRGNFEKQVTISEKFDEIDGVSSNINMLGEELKAAMISKNYFNNIFNAVTDIVLVLNNRGIILDANYATEIQAGFEVSFLKGKPLNTIQLKGLPHTRKLLAALKLNKTAHFTYCRLKTRTGIIIPVSVNLAYFYDELLGNCILLTASDISYRIKTENLIIRAIIDIQEKERTRLSQDLHDSIIQEMAGVKFFISTTAGFIEDSKQKEIMLQANTAMADMIVEVRRICFNLMPRTLQEFGLVKAVQVFCDHVLLSSNIRFDIKQESEWPELLAPINIDLYRVVQEFISNAIRHGKAKAVAIIFSSNKNNVSLKLSDNGTGFQPLQTFAGMGLKNVESRIRSHDGKLEIISTPGKGTKYHITIPLN